MWCTRFRVNLLSLVASMSRSKRVIWNLSDSNGVRTHKHLVCKRTFNNLAKLASLANLAKWLRVCLRTKWLCVEIPLLSLKWWLSLYLYSFYNYCYNTMFLLVWRNSLLLTYIRTCSSSYKRILLNVDRKFSQNYTQKIT